MSPRQKICLVLSLIISTLVLALPQIRNGLNYSYGQGFWGPSGHDMIWHLALSRQSQNPLYIYHPTFSGSLLQNYHPFYNVFTFWISQITHISIQTLTFQVLPLIFSGLLVFLSFKLGYTLFSYKGGIILIFLNTFSSSFGWIVSLLRNQDFFGESIFWSMQPASTLTNPPYALSLLFILIGLIILTKNKFSKLDYIILSIISIVIPITKAYAALVWFPIFFLTIITGKKPTRNYLHFVTTTIVSYLIFRYYNSGSTGLFEFNPFWFTHSLIDSPDRLYLPRLSSYRFNLPSGVNIPLILIEIFTLSLFVIGNYGLRLLAFTKKSQILKHDFLRPVALVSLFLLLIPILFTQKGNTWNSIQFLYYSIFLVNILFTNYLIQLKPKLIFAIILFLLFIGNIGTYKTYLGNPAPASLPYSEIQALEYLSKQPKGVVLSYPFKPEFKKAYSSAPIPLYAYETTSYISAYTGFASYLADEMNLDISGYPWQARRQQSFDFFEQQNEFQNRGFLVNNQIDYIYLINNQYDLTKLNIQTMSLNQIFQNDTVTIYKVNR